MTSVLEGIRVLDLSQGISGPIASMLLSDNGAAITKVESPGGDRFRALPGSTAWLRGRRSVELDLVKAGDRATFHALVRSADVVLESFSPGRAVALGADAATLLDLNPALIHCSITGYGSHPADRDRPAYDALVAARLGILHENRGHFGSPTGFINGDEPFLPDLDIPDGMPPGPPRPGPIFNYTPWPSLCAAYHATIGINAALLVRERDGVGQHVETSLLQAVLALTTGKWQKAEHGNATGYPTWIMDQRASKGFFKCSDGRWIESWVPNPRFVLSSAAGDTLEVRSDLASARDDDERIPPDPENIIVLAHYWPAMKEAFARFPSDEWVRVAAEAGVPLQPVRTPEEALVDPALLAEGAVVEVEHPEHGRLRQVGVVYGLSATPGAVGGPVPAVGEHNDDIRAEVAALGAPNASSPKHAQGSGRPPLDGVTVLDLGFAVAGPFATQAMADLGANVIKVNARRDPYWHATHIAYGCNRGKRSICIDLKNPDGLAVLHRLVADADVVHSNMRRDALARLGCDEASLRPLNPTMIYCHTRGFDRGPRSDAPGNDQTGASLAGVTWEDGGCDDGGQPFWSLTSMGDTGNGYLSVIGVIQALYHRARTGEGQSVDTSILNAALLSASAASVRVDGTALPRPHLDRLQLGLGALYRLYESADGWLCLAVTNERQWHALGTALPDLGLATDVRFGDQERRRDNDAELTRKLETELRTKSADEWFRLFDDAGVPCEVANPSFGREIFLDPVMRDLGLIVEHQHPKLGRFEQFGTTIDFSATPGVVQGPPPIIGQHTRRSSSSTASRKTGSTSSSPPTRSTRTYGSTERSDRSRRLRCHPASRAARRARQGGHRDHARRTAGVVLSARGRVHQRVLRPGGRRRRHLVQHGRPPRRRRRRRPRTRSPGHGDEQRAGRQLPPDTAASRHCAPRRVHRVAGPTPRRQSGPGPACAWFVRPDRARAFHGRDDRPRPAGSARHVRSGGQPGGRRGRSARAPARRTLDHDRHPHRSCVADRCRLAAVQPAADPRGPAPLFHADDVPAPVRDAFRRQETNLLPSCAMATLLPAFTDVERAAITVPLFLGFGEHDLATGAHESVRLYTASSDITLFVLAGSGHCTNQAGNRLQLWERLMTWARAAPLVAS